MRASTAVAIGVVVGGILGFAGRLSAGEGSKAWFGQ
jgi:hypothetical protein